MNEEGITIGDIFRMLFKRIWWVAGATVFLTVLVTLLAAFVLNPALTEYTLQFGLTYPEHEEGKYPDGTPLYYRDLISYSALEEAKASDPRFASVNVEEMIEEDDIEIFPETAEIDGTLFETGKYVLRVKGSYFSGRSTATAFLRAVANVPVKRIEEQAAAIDYRWEEATFLSAAYEERLDLLDKYKAELLSRYSDWIELYREDLSVSGRTLKNYAAEVTALYGVGTRRELSEELESCGYVPAEEAPARISALKEEKLLVESKIEAIEELLGRYGAALKPAALNPVESTSSKGEETETPIVDSDPVPPDLSQTLAELLTRSRQIDFQIEKLSDSANIVAFEAKIRRQYDALTRAAEQMNAVTAALYNEQTFAGFATTRAVRSGDINLILAAVGAFAVSLLIVGTVVCIVESPRRKRTSSPDIPDEKQTEPTAE